MTRPCLRSIKSKSLEVGSSHDIYFLISPDDSNGQPEPLLCFNLFSSVCDRLTS